jgi:hypothetical protein
MQEKADDEEKKTSLSSYHATLKQSYQLIVLLGFIVLVLISTLLDLTP